MSFVKRIPLYILALLGPLGLLFDTLSKQRFNIDEFQHTHLAWMALYHDKLQYRDLWDNHGPLYTIVNVLFIKLADLGASVATIVAERYLNFAILILGFVVLFELFRVVTGKWYFAVLGPWFFASSMHSIHAIEVRPDNLQCLFFYIALLLLVKALEFRSNNYALVSGLFLTLMLMTNLKSLTALAATVLSLILLNIFDKKSNALEYLKSLMIALVLSLLVTALILLVTGLLPGYVQDNILFNFIITQFDNPGSLRKMLRFYVETNPIFVPLLISSLFVWTGTSVDLQIKKINQPRFILAVVAIVLVISRFLTNLWTQYDLLFLPILCFMASTMIFQALEGNLLVKISSQKYRAMILGFLILGLVPLGWYRYVQAPAHRLEGYYKALDSSIQKMTEILSRGGTMENTSLNAAEIAFLETASPRFVLQRPIIDSYEQLYGRPIYGQEYIDLLKAKDVRVIIGGPKMPEIFKDPQLIKFIRENYNSRGRFWIRKEKL